VFDGLICISVLMSYSGPALEPDVFRSLVAGIEKIHTVSFRLEKLELRYPGSGHMTVQASNTDHGQSIYNSLLMSSSIETAPAGDGPPVIPPFVIAEAVALYDPQSKRPHECHLVSLYTPKLVQVVNEVCPHLRLVNSEYFQWVRCASGHRKADLKPDLFSAHYPLVQFLPPYENAPSCAVGRLFGEFASWESRASIHCIWDAKWKIDMKAFGEKCKYLQIAGEGCVDHNGVPLKLKGILFDISEFWMIRSSENTIIDVVKCGWAQAGSMQRLKDFLRTTDPWMEAANALCAVLGTAIEDCSSCAEKGSSFLGCGANGRVFKLTSGAVIKVVIGPRSDDVEKEYALMLQCQKLEAVRPHVFPVVEGTFHSGVVCGCVDFAGYTLAREGRPLFCPVPPDLKCDLAVALHGLHAHGVIHGDPRIENALVLDGVLKWIDFRETETVTTKVSRRRDVQILRQSLGGPAVDVTAEVEAYVQDPTVERLRIVLLK
jgi:hypothetical protein